MLLNGENTAKLLAELPHEACCLKDLGKVDCSDFRGCSEPCAMLYAEH